MATEKQDIQLAIRAADLSTANLRKVEQAVDAIAESIEAQSKAAAKGEVSAAELRAQLDELRKVSINLAKNQALIASFEKATSELAKLEKEATEASAALTKLGEAERQATLTAGQQKQLENLTASLRKAEAALEKTQAAQNTFNASLKEGAALTERQAARRDRLAAQFEERNAAIAKAKTALDQFNVSLAKQTQDQQAQQEARLAKAVQDTAARVEAKKASVDKLRTSLEAAGLDSNNLAGSLQRISDVSGRAGASYTTLAGALQAYARNSKEAAQAAQATREAEDLQRRIKGYKDLAEQARRTADSFSDIRLDQIAIAEKGVESRGAISSVLVAEGGVANVNTVRRQTITGLQQVVELQDDLTRAVVKGTGPVRNYVETLQDMERTLARVRQVAGLVDAFRTQESAVAKAKAAYDQARESFRRLNAEVDRIADAGGSPSSRLMADMQRAATATASAGNVLRQQEGRLNGLRQSLRDTGIDTSNLAKAQDVLARSARTTTQNLASLQRAVRQRGVAEGDNLGVLGLRPYEIQNLSFQVNDFFTQIASGTPVMQAFAQQIGQVVQIGRIGPMLLRAAPAFITVGAAIGIMVVALTNLNDRVKLLRQARVDQILGGSLSPETISNAADAARRLGVSFSEAANAARAFGRIALPVDQYRNLVTATIAYGQATNDVEAATKKVSDAFRNGVQGILELDNELHFLDATQRQFIVNARSQEDVIAAQRMAIGAFSQQAQAARREAMTPLSESFKELRTTWQDFLKTLQDAGLRQFAIDAVDFLTRSVIALTAAVKALGEVQLPDWLRNGTRGISSPEEAFSGFTDAAKAIRDFINSRVSGSGIAQLRASGRLPVQGRSAVTPLATRDYSGSPEDRAAQERDQAALIRQAEEIRKQAEEAARQARERQDNERATLQLQRQQAQVANEELNRMAELQRLEETIRIGRQRTATATQRQQGQEAAARKEELAHLTLLQRADAERVKQFLAEERAREQARQEEAARSQADANARTARSAARRELADIQRDIAEVERMRREQAAEIQEDVASGAISGVEGMRRLQAVTDQARERFRQLNEEVKKFADSPQAAGVLRDLTRERLINRTESLAGGQGENAMFNQILQQQQQQLRNSIQERQQLVQEYQTQERLGVISTTEANEKIQEAYDRTRASIEAQIAAIRGLVQAQLDAGRIDQTRAAQIEANLKNQEAQLERLNPQYAKLMGVFVNTASEAFIDSLNQIAAKIGEVINGTAKWSDVMETAGQSILQMFAKILQAMAEAIIRQMIINALAAAADAISPGSGNIIRAAGAASRDIGGVVGSPGGKKRMVDPAVFAGARHYATGGLVGLRPGEEAAILHAGEEVLKDDDPRNIMNIVKGQQTSQQQEVAIRNVLVMTPSMITDALAGAEGERLIISTLKKNAATVRNLTKT